MISALNILNEMEINYKAARNKKLHVELTLIKLCYLQQALSLATDTEGVTKKIVENTSSVAFRNIAPLEIKEQDTKIKDKAQGTSWNKLKLN